MTLRNRAERRATMRRAKRAAAAALTMSSAVTGAISLIDASPASAATYTVTNLLDTGTGSLRQAILDANANAGSDIIDFQPGLTGTITLASGLPVVTDDVEIRGPGAGVIKVDGVTTFSLFQFKHLGTASISGLTLTGGNSTGNINDSSGGGIAIYQVSDMTVSNMVVTGNSSLGEDGGGISCYSDSTPTPTLTVTHSVISGNTTGESGGGLYTNDCALAISYTTVSGNTATGGGGGLYFTDSSALIRNSTFSGNHAGAGGGMELDANGGQAVTIVNSTISGNHATSDNGGGLYFSGGKLVMIESTVTGNTAATTGGLYAEDAGAAALRSKATNESSKADDERAKRRAKDDVGAQQGSNDVELIGTILAGNSGFDLTGAGNAGQLFSDHSLIGTVDPTTTLNNQGGTLLGVDPVLGPLANNGGPTQTHALLSTSPAINAGPTSLPAFPGNGFDQRGTGFARVLGGQVDIGAFEFPVLVALFTG